MNSLEGKVTCRLFTVPIFFVRLFRYTASYRHGHLDFQMYRGGRGQASEIIVLGEAGGGVGEGKRKIEKYFSHFFPNRPRPPK